ncbi:cytochrome c [Chitinophaga sp. 30R24]|uniref:cytochrome c n=1 Tax=Chitinophaga sp. 30R24 TaxID=3248838 RepID=UPI003B8FE45A
MFSKILKWTGATLLGLVLLVGILYGVFSFLFYRHINKTYTAEVRDIPIPEDSATVAIGRHLYEIKGCGECHGERLEGKVFVNDPALGKIAGNNLTYGKGGLPANFNNKSWLRALRHGLNAQNKTLLLMPSEEFNRLDDHDIAAIIAFCKAQPPIDQPSTPIKIGPVGKVLSVLGKVPLFAAEKIDQHQVQPALITKAPTAAYGKYLSVSCTGCHQPSLTGGPNPVPGGVAVANITASGHVGKWSKEEFIATLRTGKTPEGKQLQAKDMPWPMTAKYTDEELAALYLYLRSL